MAVDASLTSPGLLRHGTLYVTDHGCNVLLAIDGGGHVHLVADASTAGG